MPTLQFVPFLWNDQIVLFGYPLSVLNLECCSYSPVVTLFYNNRWGVISSYCFIAIRVFRADFTSFIEFEVLLSYQKTSPLFLCHRFHGDMEINHPDIAKFDFDDHALKFVFWFEVSIFLSTLNVTTNLKVVFDFIPVISKKFFCF